MPFKKGQSGNPNGRPKGSRNKHQKRSGEWKTAKLTNGKQSVSRYIYALEWDKSTRKKIMDQEEIDYRINNDLPLDDLFDKL